MAWRPTEFDRERFTCGDCHILAKAIEDRTGWPLHAMQEKAEGNLPTLHAFVIMPDGRALDVDGPSEVTDFLDRWRRQASSILTGYRQVTIEEIEEDWGTTEVFAGSRKRAAVVAERLLAQVV